MRRIFPYLLALLLFVACGRKEEPAKASLPTPKPAEQSQVMIRAMPGSDPVRDDKRGTEVWLAIAAMVGTDATPANGVVVAHAFEDGHYLLTMQLNIAAAAAGSSYVVWLGGPEGKQPMRLGVLQPVAGDARHSLQFEAEEDLRAWTAVNVTLEPKIGGETEPAAVVATATLKPVKR